MSKDNLDLKEVTCEDCKIRPATHNFSEEPMLCILGRANPNQVCNQCYINSLLKIREDIDKEIVTLKEG